MKYLDAKKNLIVWGLINIALPMLIGTVLYYLFCPGVWFVKVIDTVFNLDFHISVSLGGVRMFIRNYLFDFLWAYSFAGGMYLIVSMFYRVSLKVLLFMGLIVGGLELIQLIPMISGTFDPIDILFEIVATLICFISYKLRRDCNEKEN